VGGEVSTKLSAPGSDTHNIVIAYVLWLFGFMGAHRF
jgi:TM2 domain-containing membrane protein YozV